jgi:hypothetical protein
MQSRFWTGWSFIILGLATALTGIVILTIRILALQRWTAVEGEVLNSILEGPDIDEVYYPKITIRWTLNGGQFTKTFNNWGRAGAASSFDKIMARYPKGSRAPILCDPANPSRVFLEAGYTLSFFIAPAGVALGGIAATFLGYFILRLLPLPAR